MACVRHLGSKIGAISSPERRQAACAGWAAPRRRAVLTCRMCWRPRAMPGMPSEGVPSGAVGRDDGRMRSLRRRPRAVPAIPFPPRRRPDAFPVMAPEGVPGDGLSRQWMRSLRWRAHARFARVGGRVAAITGLNQALTFTRIGRLCPPNAWRISRAAMIDRNGVCAQSTFQNRTDLGRRNGVRLHALVGRHHPGGA